MSGSADESRRSHSKRSRSKSGSPGRTALHILDSMSDAVLALHEHVGLACARTGNPVAEE